MHGRLFLGFAEVTELKKRATGRARIVVGATRIPGIKQQQHSGIKFNGKLTYGIMARKMAAELVACIGQICRQSLGKKIIW